MNAHVLNETALRALKRPEIQKLAKREKVKATSKTDTIIGELLAKYPSGIPSLEKETMIARKSRRIAGGKKIKDNAAEQQQHLFLDKATVANSQANDGPKQSEQQTAIADSGNRPWVPRASTREEGVASEEQVKSIHIAQAIQGSSAPMESPVLAPQPKQDGLTTGRPASTAAQPEINPRLLDGAPVRQVRRIPVHTPQPQPEAGPSRMLQPVPQRNPTLAREKLPEGDDVPAHTRSRGPMAPRPQHAAPQPQPEAGPSRIRRAPSYRADQGEDEDEPPRSAARPVCLSQRVPFAERPAGARPIQRGMHTLAPHTPASAHSRIPQRVPAPQPQSSPEPAFSSSPVFSPTRPNAWDSPLETGAASDGADEELAILEKAAKSRRQLDPNGPIVGCSTQGLKRVRRGIKAMMGRVTHVEGLDKTMRTMDDSREDLPGELEELRRRELKIVAGRMVLEQAVLGMLKNKEAGWLDASWRAPTEWCQERNRKAEAAREKARRKNEAKAERKRQEEDVVKSRVNNMWTLKTRGHGINMSPPGSPAPIPQLRSPFRFDPTRRPRNVPAPPFPQQRANAMLPRVVPQAYQQPAARRYAPAPTAAHQSLPAQPAARRYAPAQPTAPAYHRGQQGRNEMPPPLIPHQPAPRVEPVSSQTQQRRFEMAPPPPPTARRQPAPVSCLAPEEDDVPTPSSPDGHILPASFHPSGAVNQSRSDLQQPEAGPSWAPTSEPRQALPSVHDGHRGAQANGYLGQPLPPLGVHSAAFARYYASLPGSSTGLQGSVEPSAYTHSQLQAGPSASQAQSSAGPSADYSIGEKRRRVDEEDLEYEEDAVSYASDEPDNREDRASYEEDAVSYEENDENDENEHHSEAVAARSEQVGYRPRPVPGYNGYREASPESRWGSVSGYVNWAPAPNAPYKRYRYE